MKIDEAINFVENMLYLYRPTGEQHDKWCELLNLLRWYREQDLIDRKELKDTISVELCDYCIDKNCDHQSCMAIGEIIDEIPKAEPPKE